MDIPARGDFHNGDMGVKGVVHKLRHARGGSEMCDIL